MNIQDNTSTPKPHIHTETLHQTMYKEIYFGLHNSSKLPLPVL